MPEKTVKTIVTPPLYCINCKKNDKESGSEVYFNSIPLIILHACMISARVIVRGGTILRH